MKKLLVFIFYILAPLLTWAQSTSIITAGNWNDSGIWLGGNIGDNISEIVQINTGVGIVTIQNGDSYVTSIVYTNKDNTLSIELGGSLEIGALGNSQDLNGLSNTTLSIDGDLEIWGNIYLGNLAVINVTGNLIIHEGVYLGNNAILNVSGDLTIGDILDTGVSAIVTVDGSLDVAVDAYIGNSSTLSGSGTVTIGGICSGPDEFCLGGPLDTMPPVISGCPSDIIVGNDNGVCDAGVTWTEPTATDNMSVDSFTSSHTSGDTFPVGVTTVTYTATDVAGNEATCSFTVTVNDTTVPVIAACPADIDVNITGTGCDEVVTWVAPTATDNCSVASFVSSHDSGDTFPVGVTTVTYTATDVAGNEATCSFTVTVNDTTVPVIAACPADIDVNITGAGCDEVVTWVAPTATDNCSVASFVSSHDSGDTFPVGVTTVTYTATDVAGNEATCSFTVTVNDTTVPVIAACPADIDVNITGAGCDEVVTWVAPTATDNCSVASFVSSHASGDTFPVGVTTVTYTATDVAGNEATCSFTVTVNDTTVPVIAACPADIEVNITGAGCDEVVTWVAPTATDNCSVASFVSSHASGDTFPVGVTTVTYTATDVAGNEATCSFTVTVNDTTVPVIAACPADIEVNITGAGCDEVVTWVAPTATDNCSVASFVSSHASGDTFSVGVTTVTYTATDVAGNEATCSFTVTVNDTTVPVIAACPADIEVNITGAGCDEVVTWVAPTATDNCSVASFVSSHASGDTFPVGVTTVTYTATDLAGNEATCSFTVTVNDTTVPVIADCPADIDVNITGAGCDEVVTWIAPTATDNCSVDSFVSSHTSGDTFPIGVTTVTYTATDVAGNEATCSFTVTVNDTTVPMIADCPADIDANITGAGCDEVVTWAAPTATDNCSVASFVSSHASGDTFPAGVTTVTYTAMDVAGNEATCSFTVTINDIIVPVFDFCPTSVVIADFDVVNQASIVTWNEPLASDNCESPVISSNFNSGDMFPPGTTKIIYTATDNAGNITTCEFDVNVQGNRAPIGDNFRAEAYSGEPTEICLDVIDLDNDDLSISEVNYATLNGSIDILESNSALCLLYTSFDDFEGEELINITVCDNGSPSACTIIEVRINVAFDLRLTVYKAITPNNDNINDDWVIENIENYPNNRVSIYDRYGGLIYSAKNYNNVDIVWQGQSNQNGQELLASGTYFYRIDLGNNQDALKGYVELVR